ncbi:MAG: alpha-L-fucosidase [Candidatus Aminicenantales bacterium]
MRKFRSKSMARWIGVGSLCGVLALGILGCAKRPADDKIPGQKPPTLLAEDKVRLSNDPAKTEMFRDAGLGLFIHWGPNSQMGTEISWPLYNASDDYVKKYYGLAETFNPVDFDPKAWARLAKLAGVEYVVFTAKHHDGFCMFDTAYSDFKITRTPYGRDILAGLVDAFRREGLLVGIYYSPGDFRYQYETGHRFSHLYEADFASPELFGPLKKNFADYERGQVEELLTRYGDVFMIWFDGKCEPLKKQAWRVKQDVFIGRGEIPTPEQEIPGQASDHAWESCMTTSIQWSYQPDPDIRTPKEIIKNLIAIRARGGNMLLNVGPRPEGRIADPDVDRLRDLGLWMMLYGEAVRGIRPWVVTNEGDVWFTQRRDEKTVYAFADLDYGAEPATSSHRPGRLLTLRSLKATPTTKVTLLSQAGDLEWKEDAQGLHIQVERKQTVQMIRKPGSKWTGAEKADNAIAIAWGPDWPVALKITNVQPVQNFLKKEK